MTPDPGHLEHARQVANAVLYEGYLLYPYRRSAQKNRTRFQFGVLMPPAYRAVDDCEPSASQTECLVECSDDARVDVLVRFLHFQRRTVQRVAAGTGAASDVDTLWVDGTEYTSWDEAVEREQSFRASVADLLGVDSESWFQIGAGEEAEEITDARGEPTARLVRRWEQLDGAIRVRAERVAGPYGALRLRVRVENHSEPRSPLRCRDDGLRYLLIAAHALIAVPGGAFLSLTDPPEWAAAEAAACANIGTWPVLAGPGDCRDLLLSSPVILYDHPEVAPESAGDLFDATEIDEILTLRTLALTDDERRQARATDPRAADLIDRLDVMPPEMLERMHGAIRYLSPAAGPAGSPTGPAGPAGPPAGTAVPVEPRRRPGGTRGRIPRSARRPTTSWSAASRSPGEARCGCGPEPGGPTPRTCSSSGARRSWKRCYTTWTARCTWRSARPAIPSPNCSAITAGSSTSPRTRSSRLRRPPRRAGFGPAPPTSPGRRKRHDRQPDQGSADRGGPDADCAVAAGHQAVSRTPRNVTRNGREDAPGPIRPR